MISPHDTDLLILYEKISKSELKKLFLFLDIIFIQNLLISLHLIWQFFHRNFKLFITDFFVPVECQKCLRDFLSLYFRKRKGLIFFHFLREYGFTLHEIKELCFAIGRS